MPIKHTYPSGWGADGSTSPADDADANTVSPTQYKASHTGNWIRRLAANAVSAVTAMADIHSTDLTVAIEASKSYRWRLTGTYVTNATTTGIRLSINGPASPTFLGMWLIAAQAGSVASTAMIAGGVTGTTYDTPVVATTTGPLAAISPFIFEGIIENGTTAGNLRPRFASEVAVASGLTIHRGCIFEVTEIDN